MVNADLSELHAMQNLSHHLASMEELEKKFRGVSTTVSECHCIYAYARRNVPLAANLDRRRMTGADDSHDGCVQEHRIEKVTGQWESFRFKYGQAPLLRNSFGVSRLVFEERRHQNASLLSKSPWILK